jgi:hypothetical protein
MKHIRGFIRFWYDFVVGDDWRVAVGIAVAIAITAALAAAEVSAWWVMPAGVTLIVYGSLRRAVRRAHGS